MIAKLRPVEQRHNARTVPRSQLLEVIRIAINSARRERRGVGVLMLRVSPHDRLHLFTKDSMEAELQGVLSSLPDLLRPADCLCFVDARQVCVVLPNLTSTAQAFLASHKLSRGICEAINNAQAEWPGARPLIGIACYPEQAGDAESLLVQADAAAAEADQSESGICAYAKQVGDSTEAHLPQLRARILDLLSSNDFHVVYQPQVNLASGRCESAEVLLRATLPDGTALAPALLVAVAEHEGRVGALTSSVLNASLRQLSLWDRTGVRMRLSVNLSPHNLRDPDLPAVVARSLESWGVQGERLTLEIVESSMIHSFAEAASVLHRLKEVGVKLALDDFGTGYSCLAYLRQLPLDELKVDQAFVRGMHRSREDRQLVRAIIDLAHNFDLPAVAEGVEDDATLCALREMGCDLVQGYGISPGREASDFMSWLSCFAGRQA